VPESRASAADMNTEKLKRHNQPSTDQMTAELVPTAVTHGSSNTHKHSEKLVGIKNNFSAV
jgi:hypothetical protein